MMIYIELMALMTNCLFGRPCPRRIQEIRLLLRQIQQDTQLSLVLQERLEKISDDWQRLA